MKYELSKPIQLDKAKKRFNALLKKQAYIELTEIKPNRTLKQNRYLHLILNYFAMETGYTLESVKQAFFKQVNGNDTIFLVEQYGFKYYRSTSSLDTKEMTIAIDNFREYSEHVAEIRLPLPNEHEFLREIQYLMQLEESNK